MGKITNYPTSEVDLVPAERNCEIHGLLNELYSLPRVKTNEDVEKRINQYFDICERRGERPGVSQLALALGVSRQSFWNWTQGIGCDQERKAICQRARIFIESYVENLFVSGTINPISGIFLMKIWNSWVETQKIEILPQSPLSADKTPEELAEIVERDIPVDADPEPVALLDME